MPTGTNPKREREFKHLEKEFKQEGRYPGREEEVAARIVNKQRAQQGETKQAKEDDKLPIDGYQHMTVAQVRERLAGMTPAQLKRVRSYEMAHKKRKGVLAALSA